ncbi:MAG: 50S ribosomal protein L5, partial [Nitrospirota bacterium]
MAKADKAVVEKGSDKKPVVKKDTAPAEKEPKEVKEPRGPRPVPRLKEAYRHQAVPALMKEFGYKNPMQVP